MSTLSTLSFTNGERKNLTSLIAPVGTFVLKPVDGSFYLGNSNSFEDSDGILLPSEPTVVTVSSPDDLYILNDSGASASLKVLHCR